MYKVFPVWLGLLAATGGCQPSPDTPAANAETAPAAAPRPGGSRMAETMRLHDALMGRMDSLMSENQRLKQRAARLDTLPAASRQRAIRLRHLRAALAAADERMMGWMHAFRPADTVGLSAAQTAAFWTHQIQQLHQIQAQTSAALDSTRRVR